MTDRQASLPVLYDEHLLLGAHFDDRRVVVSYPCGLPLDAKAFVCDISYMQTELITGPDAPVFASAAFAGKALGVGECAFEAALTGDGSVASVALVMRTGAFEYVVGDCSVRADVLFGWLSFLANVQQGGVRAFGDIDIEEAGGSHVVLALGGTSAEAVLTDYLGDQRLPRAGEVSSVSLDAIPCIVCVLPLSREVVTAREFLIFVPPVHARALWRSLLSFTEVVPLGVKDMAGRLKGPLAWQDLVSSSDTVRAAAGDLKRWDLVRDDATFVGARGLS